MSRWYNRALPIGGVYWDYIHGAWCMLFRFGMTSTSACWQFSRSFTAVVSPTTPDPMTQIFFLPTMAAEIFCFYLWKFLIWLAAKFHWEFLVTNQCGEISQPVSAGERKVKLSISEIPDLMRENLPYDFLIQNTMNYKQAPEEGIYSGNKFQNAILT